MPIYLAQSDKAVVSILGWAFALIVLLVVMAVVVFWIKKRISATDSQSPGGFSLAELRQLHRSGAMNDEEFERAKAILLGGLRQSTSAAAPGKGAGPNIPPSGA